MFRSSTTISIVLCLACTCACLVWTATAARQARPLGDAPPALRWVPGARQHYSLATEVVARMHLPGSERSVPVQAKLSGILELALEDAGEAGARARLRLAPASYSSAGTDRAAEIGLSTPFHVAFRADGLPLRFDFPPELGAEARTVLEELVRTFQVVLGPDSGTGWTTREENATGRYRADYRVARDGTLVKEKVGFEEVDAVAMGSLSSPEVRILRSRARVRLDPGVTWVEAVELEEEARFLADGKTILESKLAATLTRTSEPPAIPDERAGPRATGSAELAQSSSRTPGEARASEPPPIDLPAVLHDLLEDLEQSGGENTASVHALRDLFAAYPDAAQQACAALAAGALGDLPAAALIHALQLAGTPATQEALGSILAGQDFGRTNRLRAALALGGQERPTSAALDGLWGAASLRASDEAEELADTCLLALGALAPPSAPPPSRSSARSRRASSRASRRPATRTNRASCSEPSATRRTARSPRRPRPTSTPTPPTCVPRPRTRSATCPLRPWSPRSPAGSSSSRTRACAPRSPRRSAACPSPRRPRSCSRSRWSRARRATPRASSWPRSWASTSTRSRMRARRSTT